MPRIELAALPDHGRAWVFPASRRLASAEEGLLLAAVDAFLDVWAAHGVPLLAGRALVEGWFLVVGVDEDASRPSGCSIDALVRRLASLGAAWGVELADHASVWYRSDGEIRRCTRDEFRTLARDAVVGPDTPVFDTSLTRLSTLRSEGLERPAGRSWHGRAFFGV